MLVRVCTVDIAFHDTELRAENESTVYTRTYVGYGFHQQLAGGRIIILEVEEILAIKLSGKVFCRRQMKLPRTESQGFDHQCMYNPMRHWIDLIVF
jgi:hypothetical protein